MTLGRSLLTLILCIFAGLSLKLSAQTTTKPTQGQNPHGGLERVDPTDPLAPKDVLKMSEEERKRMEEAEAKAKKDAEEAVKSCAACGTGMMMTIIIFGTAILVLHVALMIWVARDAKARGMDSSVLWMFLVMGVGIIGLIIYLCSRPQGALAVCPSCGGKRLAVSAVCPHCQNP